MRVLDLSGSDFGFGPSSGPVSLRYPRIRQGSGHEGIQCVTAVYLEWKSYSGPASKGLIASNRGHQYQEELVPSSVRFRMMSVLLASLESQHWCFPSLTHRSETGISEGVGDPPAHK